MVFCSRYEESTQYILRMPANCVERDYTNLHHKFDATDWSPTHTCANAFHQPWKLDCDLGHLAYHCFLLSCLFPRDWIEEICTNYKGIMM